jgi:hypothetical protein
MADYRAEARRAATRYGLDPNVFVRQINQESGFNPSARSPKGATGIAQIMPDTAKGWGVDPTDPIASLNAAAKNMASYVKQFGSYKNALIAYNAGPGAVGKPLYAETANYIKTILGGQNPTAPKATASSVQTSNAPQTSETSVTTGGDTATIRAPVQRERPTVTGPALPGYVKNLPPVASFPDRAAPQASIRDALAALSSVPQTTTTTQTPQNPTAQAAQTSAPSSGKAGSKVLELIYNDGGKGFGIKDGQTVSGAGVFSAVWDGHKDHVHVAAGPKTVVALGKLAQSKFGLHVGENPSFGGENPASHVANSYHNKAEAIDVSGDASKMKAFAKYVASYNRTHALPAP